MSDLTRCHLQYASRCSHFLSYLVNMICFLLHIFHVKDSAECIWFTASFFFFHIPETHNNTANCLLSVMIANRVSLTCSECLKCRGSHLLVRCPRHTASTGEKRMLITPIQESYFPIKLKAVRFALQFSPSQVPARYNNRQ